MTATPRSILLFSNWPVPQNGGTWCVVRNLAHCQCSQASAHKTADLLRCGKTYARTCATIPEGLLSPNSELGRLSRSQGLCECRVRRHRTVIAAQHRRYRADSPCTPGLRDIRSGLLTVAVCRLGRSPSRSAHGNFISRETPNLQFSSPTAPSGHRQTNGLHVEPAGMASLSPRSALGRCQHRRQCAYITRRHGHLSGITRNTEGQTAIGEVEESLTRPDRVSLDEHERWGGTHKEAQPLRPAVVYHPPRWGLARVRSVCGECLGALRVGGPRDWPSRHSTPRPPDMAATVLTNRILPFCFVYTACQPQRGQTDLETFGVEWNTDVSPAMLEAGSRRECVYQDSLPTVDFIQEWKSRERWPAKAPTHDEYSLRPECLVSEPQVRTESVKSNSRHD